MMIECRHAVPLEHNCNACSDCGVDPRYDDMAEYSPDADARIVADFIASYWPGYQDALGWRDRHEREDDPVWCAADRLTRSRERTRSDV